MWKTLIVVGLALAGCKRPDDDGAVLAQMEGFATAMCGCTNKACADKVSDDLTQWGQERAKHPDSREKPTPERTNQAATVMEKYTICLAKRMMADAPSTPPR